MFRCIWIFEQVKVCISQDSLGDAVTNKFKAWWLNITEVYFSLTLHVQPKSVEWFCSGTQPNGGLHLNMLFNEHTGGQPCAVSLSFQLGINHITPLNRASHTVSPHSKRVEDG